MMKSIILFTLFIGLTIHSNAQIGVPTTHPPDTIMDRFFELSCKISYAFSQDQFNICLDFYDSLKLILGNDYPPSLSTLKIVLSSYRTLMPNTSDSIKEDYMQKINALYEEGLRKYGPKIMEGGYEKEALLNGEFEVYSIVDSSPLPREGWKEFNTFIINKLAYPKAAIENGIEGRVFVVFIVDKEGYLNAVRPIRGIGYGCDEEAVRLIEESSPWEPGKLLDGKKVFVRIVMPIDFNIRKYVKNQPK